MHTNIYVLSLLPGDSLHIFPKLTFTTFIVEKATNKPNFDVQFSFFKPFKTSKTTNRFSAYQKHVKLEILHFSGFLKQVNFGVLNVVLFYFKWSSHKNSAVVASVHQFYTTIFTRAVQNWKQRSKKKNR